MSATKRDQAQEGIRAICPSCDRLLSIDPRRNGNARLEPGSEISLHCSACGRDVEVTAPAGITAYEANVPNEALRRPVSEFVPADLSVRT